MSKNIYSYFIVKSGTGLIQIGDIVGTDLSGYIVKMWKPKRWPRLITLQRKYPVFKGVAMENGVGGMKIKVIIAGFVNFQLY